MAVSDPIGDLITRIRNAQMRRRTKVSTPASGLRMRVLEVLQEEGYINGMASIDKDGKSEIEIELRYFNGEPAIRRIERISKPGRRVYSAVRDLTSVANGLGVSILSTPKGVMTDTRAREENVGGEVLLNVF